MPHDKSRCSNFELLRIIAMMMVLFVHCDFLALKVPTTAQTITMPGFTAVRCLVEMLSIACVDIFIMISGYFSIRPSVKSIANLIFMLLFYRCLIVIVFALCGRIDLLDADTLIFLIPGYSDWFVQTYLLLILCSPLINAFIDRTSKHSFRLFLIIFFAVEFVFGWLVGDIMNQPFNRGYSLISFIGLYLVAAYVRRYIPTGRIIARNALLIFVTIAAISSSILWLSLRLNICTSYVTDLLTSYASPTTIAMAMCLIMAVRNLNFQSKLVNSMASSSFVIYIVHCNPLVIVMFISVCHWIYRTFGPAWYFPTFALASVVYYLVCRGVDIGRIKIWNKISRHLLNRLS